jgi:NDP-sugar pyrophosphorylase family protein
LLHSSLGQGYEDASLTQARALLYIGEGVHLQIGTLIQGPVAMLENSSTNLGAKIRGNTTIGIGCKVGGEINASLFFPYSNKAHEGYVGSSVIGSYTNWGAMSTCSNVRNDLAPISLFDYSTGESRKTQKNNFGVLMGDFVTTGIGTKLIPVRSLEIIATSAEDHFRPNLSLP